MSDKCALRRSPIGTLAFLLNLSFFGCQPYAGAGIDSAAVGADPDPTETAPLNIGRNLPARPWVNPNPGCEVEIRPAEELMITDLGVVEDIQRTNWTGDLRDPISGAWSFGRLVTAMAGDQDPSEFVIRWFQIWRNTVVLNGAEVGPRSGLASVLDAWPRLEDGNLDLTRSPFRLLAIVNRLDLADESRAGEGRFVFGMTQSGEPIAFAMNLEYSLSHDVMSTEEWAERWHALDELELGSPEYNVALQAITDAFTGVATDAADPDFQATDISQIVTNENAFGNGSWEMREFAPQGAGQMAMLPLSFTPAWGFNATSTLRDFINENESEILDGSYDIPLTYLDAPFQAAAVTYSGDAWSTPPEVNNEARHILSLNTCNGCHGGETLTDFLHIEPRAEGEESTLSGFLTGIDVTDPIDGKTIRHYAELDRRGDAVEAVLCE